MNTMIASTTVDAATPWTGSGPVAPAFPAAARRSGGGIAVRFRPGTSAPLRALVPTSDPSPFPLS